MYILTGNANMQLFIGTKIARLCNGGLALLPPHTQEGNLVSMRYDEKCGDEPHLVFRPRPSGIYSELEDRLRNMSELPRPGHNVSLLRNSPEKLDHIPIHHVDYVGRVPEECLQFPLFPEHSELNYKLPELQGDSLLAIY